MSTGSTGSVGFTARAPRQARVRAVVVDDDFAVASVHRGFVESHGGFEVVGVAHSGAEALRVVEQTTPHVILLDLYLPDMTGLDVLAELRRRDGEPVDVIAVTAARELPTVRAAMAVGVWGYVIKPFSAADLIERLDEYLQHRRELARTSGSGALDQSQVDRLLESPRPRPRGGWTNLPKGLSARTMDFVVGVLSESGVDMSAQDVADAVGLARVSARRYLEHLEASGFAHVAPRYGRAGRPENRYRWRSGTSGQ